MDDIKVSLEHWREGAFALKLKGEGLDSSLGVENEED
jgi:hypothetical protein